MVYKFTLITAQLKIGQQISLTIYVFVDFYLRLGNMIKPTRCCVIIWREYLENQKCHKHFKVKLQLFKLGSITMLIHKVTFN